MIAIENELLRVSEITESDIRRDGREYNAREWDKIIDRYAKYAGCKFYVAPPQRGYAYTRYYAVYQLEDGIIFFKSISYSASISNNGFCLIEISDNGTVIKKLLKDGKGNEGYCENNKANRDIMARNSLMFGVIYSNEF